MVDMLVPLFVECVPSNGVYGSVNKIRVVFAGTNDDGISHIQI